MITLCVPRYSIFLRIDLRVSSPFGPGTASKHLYNLKHSHTSRPLSVQSSRPQNPAQNISPFTRRTPSPILNSARGGIGRTEMRVAECVPLSFFDVGRVFVPDCFFLLSCTVINSSLHHLLLRPAGLPCARAHSPARHPALRGSGHGNARARLMVVGCW